MSNTTRNGNTVDAPIDAIRKYGFLLEEEYNWDRDTFDWDDYYREIEGSRINLAKKRLNDWEFGHEYVPTGNREAISNALKTSPLGATVFGWERNEKGLYVDGGNRPNHWAVAIIKEVPGQYYLCYDSYPEDFDYSDNPQPREFLKKLDWDYNFGCIKRYKIEAKAPSKKKTYLTLLKKSMENFYYFWDETKKMHNFFYIGVPSEETKKFRQAIKWEEMNKTEKFIFLALRGSMNKSSWPEVSQYPDISTINKKFA